MKRLLCVLWTVVFAGITLLAGCAAEPQGHVEYVIGVSQANMREPWRLVLTREIREEAAKHGNVRLIFTDATQNSDKQMRDIKLLLEYGIDLLIVSPCDVAALTPVVSEVYQSIPVIVLDRVVEGFDYSLFIGPDNYLIGKRAGEAVAKLADAGNAEMADAGSAKMEVAGSTKLADAGIANVLELCGSALSQASADRSRGFADAAFAYPKITVRQLAVEGESSDAAEDLLLEYGREKLAEIGIIFAHNDYMALGAHRALEAMGLENIRIVGVDGFSGENGGIELVRSGVIDQTITCPTGGREAVQFSLDILGEVSGVPKQVILRSHSITRDNVDAFERGLTKIPKSSEEIVDVGYAQVGTESQWRIANNESIRMAARDFGIALTCVDANQSQARQLEAVREFIRRKVDVIVISPIIESGWDEVLREARAVDIPVLLSDRRIEVEDDELFMTYIGADFIEEGRRGARWITDNVPPREGETRILELQGTVGASPSVERKRGFEEILKKHPDYKIVFSKSGDFTYQGGKDVISNYLAENSGTRIDAVFAHNDDMAIGAIDALRENGCDPGGDIKIVSVDGTKSAFKAMISGELNCTVECSPLLGPQLMKAVTDLMSGKELPLRIITDEKVYTQETAAQEIKQRKY